MGIKRIVDTQFWNDDKVIEYFSPEDKLFMLYVMTNPHTTQLGIYPINKKHMSFELGYTIDVVNVLLDRFENKYEMIKYSNETKEIAIKNYLKHSIIKGGAPVRDCLIKELKQVKNKDLIKYVFASIKGDETLNATVTSLIEEYEKENGELVYCNVKEKSNKKENDNQNDNENDNDNEVSCHDTFNDTLNDIINYLNCKLGSNYRTKNKETQKHIKARLKEGYTLEDFYKVIDKQCNKWINTEWEQYLRPQTLFGTKFENYLNAPEKATQTKNTNWFDVIGKEEGIF